jgi:hypothetical protein
VCMSLDGWSNVHNEPVVCATVTTADSDIYLADTIDTSGKAHTAEYVVEVAVKMLFGNVSRHLAVMCAASLPITQQCF